MGTSSAHSVRIVEVGPRDGLQNIRNLVDTATKIELIQRLHQTGLRSIELTSFVSPRAIPQLADAQNLTQNQRIQAFLQQSQLSLPVLVPNLKGLQRAIATGVKEVAVFISATEGFSKANINCTVDQGLERARTVLQEANKRGIAVRGYVSCIFADPYEGPTSPSAVLRCVKSLLDHGCYEVSIGDTLGVGVPADVRRLLSYLRVNGVPLGRLAGHFHDTYGSAVANVWEGYKCGLRVFDGSVAGLGGCPFAPGAKGNVASEDLVYMFERSGVHTGVDLSKLAETGVWISKRLSIANASRAGAATTASKKQPPAKMLPRLQWELVRELEGLQVYRSGVNLKLCLNRPRNGNALTSTMIADLTAQIREADSDPRTSRLIITGNGKFFCTGMDLATGSTPVGEGGSTSDAQYTRLFCLFEAIDRSTKVTIASLNGPAFGGGVGLAFACDIRVATKEASVTLSETKLGLCPATISKYVIREWGYAFAREAMLSARTVPAEELYSRGLVSQLSPSAGELSMILDALLGQLRVASPEASRMSKELVRLAWAGAGTEAQAKGIRALFDAMMGPDSEGAYGVKEFQTKRPVDWDEYSLGRASRAKL
ncbi:hypothetical protein BJY01DRAFT_262414 [Aspergillus pseudoustus]|uniref:hydroxymethylglutaryl-CoA lyase n=1 Tax=Aspergillus pseudoustus TaxID=1810923 RepID=A0ABR4K9C4_9EURO